VFQELRSFENMGTVLYVAAHPDDENTQLIAYLARGKNYRTAYLSLTRGDGGQNVLGSDFDERLGVARTQELLAARRLDGGRQFFTRAIDFGFSKDYEETLRIWNKEEVLEDMVRIIRHFQPDVIITRFSPQPGGTHGHHTASAVLAREAFKLAGDPNAYPDQLKTLKPWQPRRVFMNRWGGGNEGLQMQIGGTDPVSGTSLMDLANRSRAMHKTQGFDNFGGRGGGPTRSENLQLLDGEPATSDFMEGVDTTWNRVEGGAEVARLTAEAISGFDSNNLAANVPALLKVHAALKSLPKNPVVDEKREQLDRIVAACLGLNARTMIASAEAVPGEKLRMKHVVEVKSEVPVRWIASSFGGKTFQLNVPFNSKKPVERESTYAIPESMPFTHPYWLRSERGTGMFRVDDLSLIVEPENPPAIPIQHTFEVKGQTIVLRDEPMQEGGVDGGGRSLDVIPPVSLSFGSSVAVFVPGSTRELDVELVAFRDGLSGTVELEVPKSWKVSPAKQTFKLATRDQRQSVKFTVTAPAEISSARIVARADVGGKTYRNQRVEVRYGHLPLQLLHPEAAIKAVNMELSVRARKVGYIPGAGDDIPAALRQMGCSVTVLNQPTLTAAELSGLDAVVIGVRALNVRSELLKQMPALTEFVEGGGTLVVQYNQPERDGFGDLLDVRITRDRVTDESAEIKVLAREHPVLNSPNRIAQSDFDGWVQERGLYFPNQWNEKFTPILACGDPGEKPLEGGLLVARRGKGHVVYTSLSFFRQLPAGVPGGYRLFANLISLGK